MNKELIHKPLVVEGDTCREKILYVIKSDSVLFALIVSIIRLCFA
jgi:hypothetical protein